MDPSDTKYWPRRHRRMTLRLGGGGQCRSRNHRRITLGLRMVVAAVLDA